MNRKNALRALKNLCTFFGAIALFSYFYNWTVDLRHSYVTLASAVMCSILWFGFYLIEMQGGVTQFAARVLRTKLPSPDLAADPPTACSAVETRAVEADVTAPRPASLPWLSPRPSQAVAERNQ